MREERAWPLGNPRNKDLGQEASGGVWYPMTALLPLHTAAPFTFTCGL